MTTTQRKNQFGALFIFCFVLATLSYLYLDQLALPPGIEAFLRNTGSAVSSWLASVDLTQIVSK